MTTTINSQNDSCDCCENVNDCAIAQSALCPDCFKLSITYDPSTSSYALTLCNYIVTFSNPCCLSGSGIVLRIPLIFAQDCSLYRVNPAAITVGALTIYINANNIPQVLRGTVEGGFFNISIPGNAIALSQDGTCQCVATITFASFDIPLTKISSFCSCPALCNTVNWVIGPQSITLT